MNTNPVQVVVIAHPGNIDKQIKYRNMKTGLARQLVALGILQLLIGILCIIFQGVAVGIFANSRYAYMYSIAFIGHGFWCGIMVSNRLMSGCCGSVLGSVPCVRKVAGSNPTLVATCGPWTSLSLVVAFSA